jgi:demethylmenaquinone methyltransferase/2-methoxy-6-polyprenyl-1,4-benzoquinol methylase
MSVHSQPRDQAVQGMFDRIAGRYDLLNRVISLRLDGWWRKQAIEIVLINENPLVLDLGTGTGDLAFNAAKKSKGKARIVGLDFSSEMLHRAQAKRDQEPYRQCAAFVQGSAMASPFKGAVFDGVMTAFVLRNVSDLGLFFAETFRVLRPGGKFVSLDMFPPNQGCFSALYSIYFYRVVPWIGGLLAHDRRAYQYLSDSVRQFHAPEVVAAMISQAGFGRVTVRKFLCGAVCLHVAEKLAA